MKSGIIAINRNHHCSYCQSEYPPNLHCLLERHILNIRIKKLHINVFMKFINKITILLLRKVNATIELFSTCHEVLDINNNIKPTNNIMIYKNATKFDIL